MSLMPTFVISQAFLPPKAATNPVGTEAGILERISLRQPVETYDAYQQACQAGKPFIYLQHDILQHSETRTWWLPCYRQLFQMYFSW